MDHSDDSALPGRLVLLTTTHRIAPGLLSWPAWELLRAADLVVCPDPGNPQLPYLREAGVAVEPSAPTGRELVDLTGGGRTVVYLAGGEGDRAVTDELSRLGGSGRVHMPDLELLPGSYDLPGARLLDLVQVMDRIRRECPWSSVRTTEELVKYGIEEVYELAEAAEEGDREALREELGDVLLQVVFHARIAQDDPEEPFSIDDVAATIVDKLIHRHPHVFGDAVAETAEDVREHWLRTKAEEKRRGSITEGIPSASPRSPSPRSSAPGPVRRACPWRCRTRTPPTPVTACWRSRSPPRRPASTRSPRCAPPRAATATRSWRPRRRADLPRNISFRCCASVWGTAGKWDICEHWSRSSWPCRTTTSSASRRW